LNTALPPLMPSSEKLPISSVASSARDRRRATSRAARGSSPSLGQIALTLYSVTDVAPCRLLRRFLSRRESAALREPRHGRAERRNSSTCFGVFEM
jgi:hypothetical protein